MSEIKVQLNNVIKEFPAGRSEEPVRAVDDISLKIYDGEFFALLGASGSGKTTTLRLIAGFEQPTSGEILIDGYMMQGIPAFQRPVNTVFQDYALFPHMNVMQNITFGLQMEGVGKKEAEIRALEALELVRLPHVKKRKPRELSGGQQQRIALARALVKKPTVLLLDEPLGALDLKLRREMQFELKAMQQHLGITFIYVTHDQEEALTMANRIAVMDRGKVIQVGRPDEIYEKPSNRFVADFIGETNFLRGSLINRDNKSGQVRIGDEFTLEATLDESPDLRLDDEVTVAVRPEKIILRSFEQEQPGGLNMNHVHGQVQQVYYIGTDTRYIVRVGTDADLIVRVQNAGPNGGLMFRPKDFVNLYWEKNNSRILAD